LVEAAEFEQAIEGDVLAAERHLAVALRIAPHDAAISARYREVAGLVATLLRGKKRGPLGPAQK
jgi:hypothetical protein